MSIDGNVPKICLRGAHYDENGNPVVNIERFPDMKKMTDYAHSLDITAGWYGNNCICRDHVTDRKFYVGDVIGNTMQCQSVHITTHCVLRDSHKCILKLSM